MVSQPAKNGHEAANAGIKAMEQKQRDEAVVHFNTALDYYEAIQDDAERSTELGAFALLLYQVGFPDLSLIAAQEAVKLDERLGNPRQMAEDIVTCGNAQLHLGNTDEGLSLYRRALDICLADGDLDNAASASTNIAAIIGNQGKMEEAIHMMYQSLDYLRQKSHLATEIITRIALTQALEVEEYPPEDIFAVASPVVKYAIELRPDQWEGLRGPLEQTVRRYVQLHPETNPDAVKRDYLSGIFE